jgi:hypothetical protein
MPCSDKFFTLVRRKWRVANRRAEDRDLHLTEQQHAIIALRFSLR